MTAAGFRRPLLADEARTPEQVREHYEVEAEIARRLRDSTKAERESLYTEAYNELFRRVPHHPQLTRQASPGGRHEQAQLQYAFLARHLQPEHHLLEIGTGDCALATVASKHCAQVTAIDVSDVVSENATLPANVTFKQCRGTEVPVPDGSIDVAFSDQLMEHLHPQCAQEQLSNIARALRPGGAYVCVTPNEVAGPWDVSVYFSEKAEGLHLKEYRAGELRDLLRAAGFDRVDFYAGGRGSYFRVPGALVTLLEGLLLAMPYGLRSRLARLLPVRGILGLRLAAYKAA